MFPEAMEEVTSPLQKGHVYTYSGDFWRDAGGACATQSLLFASVALLAWKCFTRLWPWLFRRSAIASQVSRRTRALRTRLRRGSNRAAADVAARLRIVSCTMAARHVLHVCVPFFPDGRLEIKIENCCRGFRWRQVAHFHEPWVLVWQRRHNLRSGFLVCHAAVQKKSFVWFSLQTKHFFCVTWKADAIHAPARVLVLWRKVCRSVPQAALGASVRCSCLALLRGAFFADPIGLLLPLRFGECVFAFHFPTFLARSFVQVFFAQRIPIHRLLLPHVKQKLPSERQAFLKRRQRERSVDQDLAPCAAACHPNVRRYWVSTDHVDDHARLDCASLRAVEHVGEVGRDWKLVTSHFQLWVGAARVQKPHSTLHADWEDVFLIDSWNCPACSCFKTHKDILGKFVSNYCPVCWRRFCINARPPANCSMAPFQNLEFFSVEMFSRLHWHTYA